MAFLSWHDRFSMGHAGIDLQHQRLFELVNLFDDVIQMGMTTELHRILDDIISLGEEHFRHEEEVLRAVGFPQVANHIQMHDELLEQVRRMRLSLSAGGHASPKAVVRFLADWLTYHILREDMDYKPYLVGDRG